MCLKKMSLFIFLLTGGYTLSVDAGGIHPEEWIDYPPITWFMGVQLGPAWTDQPDHSTFFLTPSIQKSYRYHNLSNALGVGEIFLGGQKYVSSIWAFQLGVSLVSSTQLKLQGNIWDDADPTFNNYRFQYEIQHIHIAMKGKLLMDLHYHLTPWISASLGAGFNHAKGFQNTPLIFEALPNPNYASQTQTTFIYTAGIGLQTFIKNHWEVGMGFEFSDWGRSQLARAFGQSLHQGPTLNHVYTYGVMFNLGYFI